MNTYKTIDIARIIGIHVNTVRLYEKTGAEQGDCPTVLCGKQP